MALKIIWKVKKASTKTQLGDVNHLKWIFTSLIFGKQLNRYSGFSKQCICNYYNCHRQRAKSPKIYSIKQTHEFGLCRKNKNMAAFIVPTSEVKKSLLYIHVHCMETIITLISWYTHARYIYSTVQNNPFTMTTYEEIWILLLFKDRRLLRPGTRIRTESSSFPASQWGALLEYAERLLKYVSKLPPWLPFSIQRHFSQRLKNQEQ